jgi:N-acetylmuramoyl-L-alanine amidase
MRSPLFRSIPSHGVAVFYISFFLLLFLALISPSTWAEEKGVKAKPSPAAAQLVTTPKPSPAGEKPAGVLKPSSSTVRPTATPAATPEPANSGSLTDALKSLHLAPCTKIFIVGGKKIEVPLFLQEKYGDLYLQNDTPEVKELFKRLCTDIVLNNDSKTVVVQRSSPRKEELSFVLENPEIDVGGEKVRLSPPPFLVRGELFLPLKHAALLSRGVMSLDKKEELYYFDPSLESIELISEKKLHILKANGTAPFETKCFILKNPRRFVMDLVNVHLSMNLLESPDKAIFQSAVGRIVYSQNEANPNRVRIVVPLQEGLKVQEMAHQKSSEAVLSMAMQIPSPVGINFTTQKVSGIKITPAKDSVRISIKISGPVEYGWHRFPAPDNRYFVDIHKALLVGKKEKKELDNPLVEEVRTGQFQSTPEPIVRVVLDLKERYKCIIDKNVHTPELVELLVTRDLVSSDDAVLDGTGVTSYPKQGKRVICIDPGHGGMDSGAVNSGMKLCEKEITLAVAKNLSNLLVAEGWNVVLTRTSDRDVSYYGSTDSEELSARVRVAHDMKADILVSIHCDAATNQMVRGISTHWYKESDYALAKALHDKMIEQMDNRDRKLHQNRFYVLTGSTMPASLVEIAFITNSEDGANLNTPAYREKIAHALADGITTYLKLHPKKEGTAAPQVLPPKMPAVKPAAPATPEKPAVHPQAPHTAPVQKKSHRPSTGRVKKPAAKTFVKHTAIPIPKAVMPADKTTK